MEVNYQQISYIYWGALNHASPINVMQLLHIMCCTQAVWSLEFEHAHLFHYWLASILTQYLVCIGMNAIFSTVQRVLRLFWGFRSLQNWRGDFAALKSSDGFQQFMWNAWKTMGRLYQGVHVYASIKGYHQNIPYGGNDHNDANLPYCIIVHNVGMQMKGSVEKVISANYTIPRKTALKVGQRSNMMWQLAHACVPIRVHLAIQYSVLSFYRIWATWNWCKLVFSSKWHLSPFSLRHNHYYRIISKCTKERDTENNNHQHNNLISVQL